MAFYLCGCETILHLCRVEKYGRGGKEAGREVVGEDEERLGGGAVEEGLGEDEERLGGEAGEEGLLSPRARLSLVESLKETDGADPGRLLQQLQRLVVGCAGCGGDMAGCGVTALGRVYHPACLLCLECGARLQQGGLTAGPGGEPRCLQCGGPPCSSCGEPVTGTAVRVGGSQAEVYHAACLACTDCGSLPGSSVTKLGSSLLCQTCLTVRLADPTCTVCSNPISAPDQAVETGGEKFHAACLKVGNNRRPG